MVYGVCKKRCHKNPHKHEEKAMDKRNAQRVNHERMDEEKMYKASKKEEQQTASKQRRHRKRVIKSGRSGGQLSTGEEHLRSQGSITVALFQSSTEFEDVLDDLPFAKEIRESARFHLANFWKTSREDSIKRATFLAEVTEGLYKELSMVRRNQVTYVSMLSPLLCFCRDCKLCFFVCVCRITLIP